MKPILAGSIPAAGRENCCTIFSDQTLRMGEIKEARSTGFQAQGRMVRVIGKRRVQHTRSQKKGGGGFKRKGTPAVGGRKTPKEG